MQSSDSYSVMNEIFSITHGIAEMYLNSSDNVVLWMHPHTFQNYELLKKEVIKSLNGAVVIHDGIPRNPSYFVFRFEENNYALYFDRECNDEHQIMHLEKHSDDVDYSSLW